MNDTTSPGPLATIEPGSVSVWADRIRPHLSGSVEGILAAGRELAAAKADLPHGQFGPLLADLTINRQTAFRLMAVALNPVLSNVAQVQHLPASWGTLYELTKVPEARLVEAIETGEVTPSMTRSAAKKLIPPKPGAGYAVGGADWSQGDVLPSEFVTVAVDPPWQYDNVATRGAAEDHYGTMNMAELCALDIDDLPGLGVPIADNAHLYLWVTNGFLRQGFDLIDAWGFTYKACLTWCKPQIGTGNYFRNSTEHVLFGLRGRLPTMANNIPTWFSANRTRHSAKPESFYDLVEASSPGPYLDVFSRRRRFGWMHWGNEA